MKTTHLRNQLLFLIKFTIINVKYKRQTKVIKRKQAVRRSITACASSPSAQLHLRLRAARLNAAALRPVEMRQSTKSLKHWRVMHKHYGITGSSENRTIIVITLVMSIMRSRF